jgi:DNA polymerase-3 subunit gamma/tau
MAHVSLYRKWRPRAMAQIVGQEPIVRTLTRAVETGKVAHAYLFSGPRGTGKTSTAKVLAMGLNCERGPTPEPCGECASCRAIINNSSIDVLEMDAASNRGIDEIRELRDRVNLAPAQGRKKVYIIDEVHMLTTEAFNALLKMLEEPPEHVVFVLATTEKHKVLPTIVSRCQSFDFRRPGIDTLVEKLDEISAAEGIEVESGALAVIARAGNGSFRDAEGLLDQLASFAEGPVTAGQVRELLGSVGSDVLLETVDALNERRAGDALRVVDRLSREGRDPGQFVQELLAHLKRLMLLPHAPELALAEVGGGEREPLEEQARRVPSAEVVRIIEAFGETLGRIKRGGNPRLELELTVLKLAREYTEPSVENLLARLERLEQALASGAAPRGPQQAGNPPEREVPESPEPAGEPDPAESAAAPEEVAPEPTEPVLAEAGEAAGTPEEKPEEARPGGGEDPRLRKVSAEWRGIIQSLKERRQALTATLYEEGRPTGFDGDVLEVAFPAEPDFYVKQAASSRHSDALKEILEERLGEKVGVRCRVAGEAAPDTGEPERKSPEPEPRPEPVSPLPEEPRQEVRPAPEREDPPKPEGRAADGGGDGDDIIQSPQEAIELVRDALGSEQIRGR